MNWITICQKFSDIYMGRDGITEIEYSENPQEDRYTLKIIGDKGSYIHNITTKQLENISKSEADIDYLFGLIYLRYIVNRRARIRVGKGGSHGTI